MLYISNQIVKVNKYDIFNELSMKRQNSFIILGEIVTFQAFPINI
jgi:hypothetical protein